MPGPATYDQTQNSNVKTFTMGTKQKDKYNKNPGPGTYETTTETTKESSRTYVIGSEKRVLKFGEG